MENDVIKKLYSGENLTEDEIWELLWDSNAEVVVTIEGDDHRWVKGMSTILSINGDLWEVDWVKGLTECQDNEYPDQPYRVSRHETVVTRIEVTYRKIKE